jgi:hypothetical protein
MHDRQMTFLFPCFLAMMIHYYTKRKKFRSMILIFEVQHEMFRGDANGMIDHMKRRGCSLELSVLLIFSLARDIVGYEPWFMYAE